MSHAYDRPIPFRKIDGLDVIRGEVVAVSTSTVTLELFDGMKITAYATTTPFTPPALDTDVVILGYFVHNRFEIVDVHLAPKGPFGEYKRSPHDKKMLPVMDNNKQVPPPGAMMK
jgi:hypothetical protein